MALICLDTSERNRISNTEDIISNLPEEEIGNIFYIVILEEQNEKVLIGLLREVSYSEDFLEELCVFACARNPSKLNVIVLNSKFSIEALHFGVMFIENVRKYNHCIIGISTSVPSCVTKLKEFLSKIKEPKPNCYFEAQTSLLSALQNDYGFVCNYFLAILDELAAFSNGYQVITCHAKSYDANIIKVLINTLCSNVVNMQRNGSLSEHESGIFYEELLNFQLSFNPESDISPILANGSGRLFQSRQEFAVFLEPLLRNDLFDIFKSHVERWNGSFWKNVSTQTEPMGLTYSDQEQSANVQQHQFDR